MIEKFNNIFYLIVFFVHFAAYGVYAFKSVITTKSFIKQYMKKKHAFFCGNVDYFEVTNLSSQVIKTENDFRLIRSIIEGYLSYDKKINYYGE